MKKLILIISVILLASGLRAAMVDEMQFEGNLNNSNGVLNYQDGDGIQYAEGYDGSGLAAQTTHEGSTDFLISFPFPDTGEMYVSYYLKMDENYNGCCSAVGEPGPREPSCSGIWNMKQFWSNSLGGTISDMEMAIQNYNADTGMMTWIIQTADACSWSSGGTKYMSFPYVFGEWIHVEIYVDDNHGTSEPNSVTVHINGAELGTHTFGCTESWPGAQISVPSIKAWCSPNAGEGTWFIDNYQVWDEKLEPTGNLVIRYGFEDWDPAGGANTTPGYIFSTGYPEYWDTHLASTEVIDDSVGAYSGNFYFHRQFNDDIYDPLLNGTATSISDHGNVGLNGRYPENSGNPVRLQDSITSDTMTVRFRFRTTDEWKNQTWVNTRDEATSAGNCKFLRVLGTGGEGDPASAFVHIGSGDNTNTTFMLYDPGTATTEYHSTGYDLQDGDWHTFAAQVTKNNNTGDTGNITLKVWWENWEMSGVFAASRTITAEDFGSDFEYFRIASNWSATYPETLMGMDLDDIEAWDGIPGQSPVIRHTIAASAGEGGSISPSGNTRVVAGRNHSFSITPNAGYQIADVLVDGASRGAINTYTFISVSADHTIRALFNTGGGSTNEGGNRGGDYLIKPGKPYVDIGIFLSKAESLVIKIYERTGQVIKELANRLFPEGNSSVRWHGKNADGESVASGVYHYQIEGSETKKSGKVVVVR